MRVFVLGSTGMLGRYVYTYLKHSGFDVVGVDRKMLDAAEFDYQTLINLGSDWGDVFINCIGIIPQSGQKDDSIYRKVNAEFPLFMADFCEDGEMAFIHITTDCVYSGQRPGPHKEISAKDADSIYGMTKALGEPENATVIRTSIIGEELKGKASLLEWVKSNKGKEVNGYTNHIWNGVTCLQLAKIIKHMINNNVYWEGVRHVHSPDTVNKAELVKMISDVFELDITVNSIETDVMCDRSLGSIHCWVGLYIPSLLTQIEDTKAYSNILFEGVKDE